MCDVSVYQEEYLGVEKEEEEDRKKRTGSEQSGRTVVEMEAVMRLRR